MFLRRSIRLTPKTVPEPAQNPLVGPVVPGPCARCGSKSESCCRGLGQSIRRPRCCRHRHGARAAHNRLPGVGRSHPGRGRFLRDRAGLGRPLDRADPGRFQLAPAPALAVRWPGQPARSERRPVVRPTRPLDRSACRRGGRLPRGAEPLRLGNLLAVDVVDPVVRPVSNAGRCPPASRRERFAPIAVGDFTNNGILDIVAPDGVHLGTGDGTFQAPSAGGALVDPTQATMPVGDRGRRFQRRSATSTWPSPWPAPTASRSPWATATARSSRRRRSACRPAARPTRSWRATSATATPTWRSPSPTGHATMTSSCSWATATARFRPSRRSRSG